MTDSPSNGPSNIPAKRYRLTVEYDGGPFVGWQRQANGPSVQQSLEEAVTAYCGEEALVQGAGRTDAGVHARAQVAHVDIARGDPPEKVMAALNAHLRKVPVAVTDCALVSEDFHARFSAIGRTYEYLILNRRAPPALEAGRVWHVGTPLDAAAMAAGAAHLLGHHDFSTFRASECQAASPEKTLDVLTVQRLGEVIAIRAEARSFLHHQVRNIVGTLALVGRGKWTPGDVAAALAAKDRSAGGPTAPPQGLYLTGVVYEDDI